MIPDNWVRVTDKGIAAIEGKSYVEYDKQEMFIAKGKSTPHTGRLRTAWVRGRRKS